MRSIRRMNGPTSCRTGHAVPGQGSRTVGRHNHRFLTIFWLLSSIALHPAPAQEPVNFADPLVMGDGGASGTVVGDLNNDGKPEFLVSAGGARIRIYEWNPSSKKFAAHDLLKTKSRRMDRFGGDLELADLNNDGWLDLIVPDSANSKSKAGKLTWFENPRGQLGEAWSEHEITTWNGKGSGNEVLHMSEVATGDIDGNGWVDVVTRDINHGFWVMLRKDGGKEWAPRKFVPTLPREGLALFDPDSDGDLDILLNGVWFETPDDPISGEYVKREIRGAEAWYPTGATNAEVKNYASKVEVADWNHDGRQDFIITNAEELAAGKSPTKPPGIRIFLAPADPIDDPWTEVVVTDKNYGWHTCELGDFDNDGDLDIYSGRAWDSEAISVFLNMGDHLEFREQPLKKTKVYQGRAGDFDGDGDLDLWAPHQFNKGEVLYFENQTKDTRPPRTTKGDEEVSRTVP